MVKNKFLSFLSFGLITYLASLIGGLATYQFKEPWYSSLIKPSFNPPDWIFAPAWTILYLFMTISIWVIWHSKKKENKIIYLYLVHLLFNATWSIVFFIFHSIIIALINLLVLILLIIILILEFKKINMLSFYLMIPYLLWSFYALILNLSLFILN
jgi:tryptophan-rich sensory protein